MSNTLKAVPQSSGANTAESEHSLPDQETQAFIELAERFRDSTDPDEAARLGGQLGRLLFHE